jgi:hypothetical protein
MKAMNAEVTRVVCTMMRIRPPLEIIKSSVGSDYFLFRQNCLFCTFFGSSTAYLVKPSQTTRVLRVVFAWSRDDQLLKTRVFETRS